MAEVRGTGQPGGPLRIAVCGGGAPDADYLPLATDVGARLARAGAVLVCGGLGGVMEAAAAGASAAGGLTIGILPGHSPDAANPHITLPLPTGMGEMRNVLVVRFAEAVIAVGGEWGTLSEVAFAMKVGRPVILLRPPFDLGPGVPVARDAGEAVDLALRAAVAGRDDA
jgi:uncharacterized protein (TIGR00725 family)